MRRAQIIDSFKQDIVFALRTLGRQKTWAAVAIATLALGIGANSAMFSIINPLLLNPVNYPGASRVSVIFLQPSEANSTGMTITITVDGKVAQTWRQHSRAFEALEPYSASDATILRPGEEPRVVRTAKILPSFATFAGVTPLRGRLWTPEEVAAGNVVVISEAMWRTQYGAAEDILGKTFTAFDRTQTIIGVMPNAFELPPTHESDVDIWRPLDLDAPSLGVKVIGRARPGIDRVTAGKELDSLMVRAAAESTPGAGAPAKLTFRAAVTAPEDLVRFKDLLGMLGAAVVFVVLIACANVAHLLLARGAARQREMAIRAALGAGAGRLFRQLATESVILAGAGAAAGIVIGWFGLKALLAARPNSLSVLDEARMDGSALFATIVLAAVTALAFGVIGSFQAAKLSTADALKSSSAGAGHGSTGGHVQKRARGVLVVTEMALCTMLLVGATLLIRSLMFLNTRDLGFDPARLYSLSVNLPESRYPNREAKAAFYRQVADRLRTMPGVEAVIVAGNAPLSASFTIGGLQAEGQPEPPAGTTQFIHSNVVPMDYFRVMRMRMAQGATFTDTTPAAHQVVVNETMARQLWPGQPAVGKRMRVVYAGQGEWKTVTGVVANALNMGRTDRDTPIMYTSGVAFNNVVLARMSGDAAAAVTAMGKLPREIDSKLAPPSVQDIEAGMRRSVARPRFTMLLLIVFAVIAVGLAAVGLYGVLAYQVAQRTREIGIRVALGASRGAVARSVLVHGVGLAVVGAAIGLVGARGGVKVVSSMLYGVQPGDALSFALSALALTLIAALACLVPMRRALAVDPLIAMRAD